MVPRVWCKPRGEAADSYGTDSLGRGLRALASEGPRIDNEATDLATRFRARFRGNVGARCPCLCAFDLAVSTATAIARGGVQYSPSAACGYRRDGAAKFRGPAAGAAPGPLTRSTKTARICIADAETPIVDRSALREARLL